MNVTVIFLTCMKNMFLNAASFDQDLCSWGSKIASSADVTNMFRGSGCSDTGTPILSAIPSPLCEIFFVEIIE